MDNDIQTGWTRFIEDINTLASVEGDARSTDATLVFLNEMRELLGDEFPQFSSDDFIDNCYVSEKRTPHSGHAMHLDAAVIEDNSGLSTLTLVYVDYDGSRCQTLTRADLKKYIDQLKGFYLGVCDGFFKDAEHGPVADLAKQIERRQETLCRINFVVLTSNFISNRANRNSLKIQIPGRDAVETYVSTVSIEEILRRQDSGDVDSVITTDENQGFPCLKAPLLTDDFDAYLVIVPGKFLADIYLKYGGRLLQSNVRAYLSVQKAVNKGIRTTLKEEQDYFFPYNNGICATATSVEVQSENGSLSGFVTSFNNLQIINGGQTTATLAYVQEKDKVDLSNVFVQMKLTIIKDCKEEFVNNIARYANSQNKVSESDLNSGHPFYAEIEKLSRKISVPLTISDEQYWFFERTKKQYDQGALSQTPAMRKRFQKLNPRSKKFNVVDCARYINVFSCRPYDVSWGSDVNASRFQKWITAEWGYHSKNCKDFGIPLLTKIQADVCTSTFFKELVSKLIIFKSCEKVLKQSDWFKNWSSSLRHILAYSISRVVNELDRHGQEIDYAEIWKLQTCPNEIVDEVVHMARTFTDMYKPILNQGREMREICKVAPPSDKAASTSEKICVWTEFLKLDCPITALTEKHIRLVDPSKRIFWGEPKKVPEETSNS